MNNQTSTLDWNDEGVPISKRFDDPYYSLADGLEETRHVFLRGNDLPARFADGFQIAELGFGTGLNLLASWQAWRDSSVNGVLRFTSFELFPLRPDQMRTALQTFPELAVLAEELLDCLSGSGACASDLHFELITGDARETVPAWANKADAWFLDGFSPAKNPELWEEPLMHAVADHTSKGGTVATYTAAGHVRRALARAGFDTERITGFGRKRHMTVGTYRT